MIRTTPRSTHTVTISHRFNGPAKSANGGYACGLVAGLIDGPSQVILRRPPPLGVELMLERVGNEAALRQGETTVATATPASVDVEAPEPPTFAQALDVTAGFGGFTQHPFPTCFVCGPSRSQGDGLRIFPTHLPGRQLMAAPWVPDNALADQQGLVPLELVWAALDCPSGWAATLMPPVQKVVVLGTLAVDVHRRPAAGRRHVLVSWPLGSERRKFYAGAALWSDEGQLLATARSTWIQVSPEGSAA
jgi:hypothetical protein